VPHLTAAVAFNIPLVLFLGVIAVSIAAMAVVIFAFVVVVSFGLFHPPLLFILAGSGLSSPTPATSFLKGTHWNSDPCHDSGSR
jgi:hypothetical protein